MVKYLETPPSVEEIKSALGKLDISAQELMRKGEQVYKDLNLNDGSKSDDELAVIMHENPILIERPVVINGEQAAIGRPPENVLEIL